MVELMSASLESHASSLTSNLAIVHHPCALFSQLTRHDDKFSKKKLTPIPVLSYAVHQSGLQLQTVRKYQNLAIKHCPNSFIIFGIIVYFTQYCKQWSQVKHSVWPFWVFFFIFFFFFDFTLVTSHWQFVSLVLHTLTCKPFHLNVHVFQYHRAWCMKEKKKMGYTKTLQLLI